MGGRSGQQDAVHRHLITGEIGFIAYGGDDAIHRHPALGEPLLRFSAGAKSRGGNQFLQPLFHVLSSVKSNGHRSVMPYHIQTDE